MDDGCAVEYAAAVDEGRADDDHGGDCDGGRPKVFERFEGGVKQHVLEQKVLD